MPLGVLEALVEQFGHLGLFILTFISSTFVPLYISESLLILAIGLGMGIADAVIIVTVASTLGGFTTYLIGSSGRSLYGRKFNARSLEKYRNIITKSGAFTVFLAALTPFPYDLIAFPAGFLKMRPQAFLVSTAMGRALRFTLIGIYGKTVIEAFQAARWEYLTTLIVIGLTVILASVWIIKKRIGKDRNLTEK